MIHLTEPLHHAYGIAGDEKKLMPELLAELEQRVGFTAKGNPDFWYGSYHTLGIDEARVIKEAAGRQAVTGGKKVFVIAAHALTREAQNALLKILEEPAPDTHFFLIVPTGELLLPTLRSRLCEISYLTKKMPVKESVSLVKSFLESAVPVRVKTVQKLLKEVTEEDAGKGRIFDFLDVLEHALADVPYSAAADGALRGLRTPIHADKRRAQALSEILEVKKYSRDRAPSFKVLLEHLALVLPKM